MAASFPVYAPTARRSRAAESPCKRTAAALLSATIGEASARVRAVLPDKPRITLADAQFVLAREYGFANWSTLKRHIEERLGCRACAGTISCTTRCSSATQGPSDGC